MDNEAVLKKIEEINKSKEWSMYRLSKESGIAQSTLSKKSQYQPAETR